MFNSVCLFVLLRPLQKEEISMQWKKRMNMGKWLYSLYHLDVPLPGLEEAEKSGGHGGHGGHGHH